MDRLTQFDRICIEGSIIIVPTYQRLYGLARAKEADWSGLKARFVKLTPCEAHN